MQLVSLKKLSTGQHSPPGVSCTSRRKQPSILTPRRLGHFARRDVCAKAKEIHSDDVNSFRNLVGSSDWSTCLPQNSHYSWNIFLFRRSIWVLLEFVLRRTQNFTKIDQEKQNRTNLYLQPRTTGLIMQTWIYVISMEFQSVRRRSPSWRNVLSGEERGKTTVFADYSCSKGK